MKKWLAWLIMFLFFTPVVWAQPQIPPKPASDIYCQDYANLVTEETRKKINDTSSQLAAKTKAQVTVVTVKSLAGSPIEEYSLALLRQWGIGDKELNNGILLLVSLEDRLSRIEVGYGLEGALPDSKTGRIQDEYLIPYFKQGEYNRGIYNTYLALSGEVAKEYNVNIPSGTEPEQASEEIDWGVLLSIIGIIIFLLTLDCCFNRGRVCKFILLALSSSSNKTGGGGSGGSGGFGGGSGGGGGSTRPW